MCVDAFCVCVCVRIILHLGSIFVKVTYHFKGGIQTQKFLRVDFELWAGGRGQDMYQQLEGGFWSTNPMLPMLGPGPKSGPKNKNSELSF